MRRILYIQHTDVISGSAVSLLHTVSSLDRNKYDPVIALVNPSAVLQRMYSEAGIPTVVSEKIGLYRHTTGGWYGYSNPLDYFQRFRQFALISQSECATIDLLRRTKPDIVHLNSVTLLGSARAARKIGIPIVWHVRESPARGLLSRRLYFIRKELLANADVLIFLSAFDQRAWLNNDSAGEVIHNFVDFREFDRTLDGKTFRKSLGIPHDLPIILYMGGLSRIKGAIWLLRSLSILKAQAFRFVCVMPSGLPPTPKDLLLKYVRAMLPLVGSGTFVQKAESLISKLGLDSVLLRLPAQRDAAKFYAASDMVVFPSVEPHFARPIIESFAMAKPVIGSRIGGVEELIENNNNGILVDANDDIGLARAITRLLNDPKLRQTMGETGFRTAKLKHDAVKSIDRIERIYDRLS